MIKWFATNKIGVAVAAVPLAAILIVAADKVRDVWLDIRPDDAWMIVASVQVPDFVEGGDPVIEYNRRVTSSVAFEGVAHVEVRRVGGGIVEGCQSRNIYPYSPGEGGLEMKLSYYINAGPSCRIETGCYTMETHWWPTLGDWKRSRPIVNQTGRFCVTPKPD